MSPHTPPTAFRRQVAVSFAAFLFVFGFLVAVPATVQAETSPVEARQQFDLPAGSARPMLRQFAAQAKQEIVFDADAVDGFTTNAVKGEISAREALERMLAGTGLVASQDKSGAFAVRKETERELKNVNRAIAQDSDRPGQKNKNDSDTYTNTQGDQVLKLPEYMVKGTKSLNADIPRSRNDIQPYVIFSHDEIAQSSALNVEDFLKTRLAMNTAQAIPDQKSGFASINGGTVNLRGLGVNQTLILVDGRRLPSTSGTIDTFGQPAISGIPLASIERIEVLPTSAGAIYGGNATGGVINIIRKQHYSGLEVQITYGNTFDTDVGSKEFNLTGGVGLNGGKTQLTFSISHFDANSLLGGDRDFARKQRELLLKNNPTKITAGTFPPLGTTTNIARALVLSPTLAIFQAGPLTLKSSGQLLSAPITFVPVGYAGPASDGGAALLANAGKYNLAVPGDGGYLVRTPTRDAFSFELRQEFSSRVTGYFNASGNRVVADASTQDSTPNASLGIAAGDPANPFLEGIVLTVPLPGLHQPANAEFDQLQLAGGAILKLPGEWVTSLEYSWGRSRTRDQSTSTLLTPAGFAAVKASAFQASVPIALDSGSFVDTPDTFGGPYSVTMKDLTLRGAGPIIALPAGKMLATSYIEHRRELLSDSYTATPTSARLYPERSQQADSAYIEVVVPVVGSQQHIRGVAGLDLQMSGRVDRYRTNTTTQSFAAATVAGPFPAAIRTIGRLQSKNYLTGLRYQPVNGFTFRASYSTGFLPPSPNQLVATENAQNFAPSNVFDPKRGNSPVTLPLTLVSGGNPDLKPEESRSTSAGLIISPPGLSGFRLSVDYTRIYKDNEITSISSQLLLQSESIYPDRIVRGPNLSGDPAGWAGPVTKLYVNNLNSLTTDLAALDYRIDFSIESATRARYNLYVAATQALSFQRHLDLVNPVFDSVGYPSTGPLEWRGNAGLEWARGNWKAGWNTQYYNHYTLRNPNPTAPASNSTTLIANQGSDTIPAQVYHDIFFQYSVGKGRSGLLSGTSIMIGIQNVFNTSPQILAPIFFSGSSISSGTYDTFGDARLRRYTITVRKSL